MSSNEFGKRDGSTLYGVFGILALLPAAFCVAFQYSARGVESGKPWLVAVFPFVLLVAARFIPSVWGRARSVGWFLVGVALAAAGVFVWDMAGLFGFVKVVPPLTRFGAPAVLAVLYGLFGLVMGSMRARRRSAVMGGARVRFEQRVTR